MDQSIRDKVNSVLGKACDERGLTLVKTCFKSSGEMGPTLEVYIDHDYAITRKEIEDYTDKVNPLLDTSEGRDESYRLDISSGGSLREIPFHDLEKFIGHYLDVKLKKDGSLHSRKLDSVKDGKAYFFYFLKGAKKKRILGEEDIDTIHRGYKA